LWLVLLFCFSVVVATPLGSSSLGAQTQPTWKQQWEKTVVAAKKEGKVVVFGPAGELIRNALAEAFGRSFPDIAFEYVGGRAAEQAMRIKAERDGGVFSVDVFIGDSVTMMERADTPEVKDPKYWRDGRLEFTNPSTRYTLVFSSQPNTPVLYDPKQVKPDEIDELYELVDPKWKGKVVLNDPLPAGPAGSLFRWWWRPSVPTKQPSISEGSALKLERLTAISAARSNGLLEVSTRGYWVRTAACYISWRSADSSSASCRNSKTMELTSVPEQAACADEPRTPRQRRSPLR
jgi:hypothetical protein